MAEWNKNKVEPSAINNGQEFKLKDNLAIDELNAIVNNSFYASDKAKRAEELAESVVKGNGTNVTIDGKIQGEWSADFSESERQKSKNLWAYGDVSGTKGKDIILEQPLPIGTYTISYVAESTDTDSSKSLIEFYDENGKWVAGDNVERNKRASTTKTFTVPVGRISFYASTTFAGGTNDTFTFSNIQIEEGEVATDYQPYNGAIVHEKDIQRHIITGHLLADYNPGTTNYTVIPLVQYSKIGNRLTMNSNGGVVIGKGVKNVMVNAGIGMYINAIGYHWISIYKNNQTVATEYTQTKDSAGRNIVLNIPRFLLPVNEGDIITFEFKDSAGNGLQSADLQTQMTVEVVE